MSARTKRPPARRWQLLGYHGKDVVHDTTCTSDAQLDAAMHLLEERTDVTKIAVKPL